eukprot:gene10108-10988_t
METETRKEVETLQKRVKENYLQLKRSYFSYLSPMVVSKLLVCLKELRNSLLSLQNLPMRHQEELAWLCLNGCKLIYDIGHPLIYYSCGKYIYESLAFAALSMEHVINLCTIRHVNFRMKLYASIFYGALSQGFLQESTGILDHATKEIQNLREREELDPPVPELTTNILQQCDEDLAIMKFVLDVWKDSDVINFSSTQIEKYTKSFKASPGSTFQARCIEELSKIHILSSGNMNETFIKRSTSLCKALATLLTAESNEDLLSKFTAEALYEIAYLVLFEGEEDIIQQTLPRLTSILTVLTEDGLDAQTAKMKSKISLLCMIQELSSTNDLFTIENLQKLNEVIEELNQSIYDESAYRAKAFYSKVAYSLFTKVVYRPIQSLLSTKVVNNGLESSDRKEKQKLLAFADSLVMIVKLFDLTNHPDPIFSHSVALLTGNVLYELKEYRILISLVKECIATVENDRAARVDFFLNLPEDIRDVYAIQRQSFTTKSEMFDWFHSEKRLGAHAFAGFGIFGLSSSADRSDQALAEIHTDLLALYFRAEITYAVQHYKERLLHKAISDDIAAKKAAETPAMKAAKEKKAKAAKARKERASLNSSTVNVNDQTVTLPPKKKTSNISVKEEVQLEKLQVIAYLKVYCAKNLYAQAILFMEMAKFETADQQQQAKYLDLAFRALEEAEKQEQSLIHSFSDLTILTNNTKKYPVVVSRSHRFIYVAPVATRKLCQKISYLRVLAKEKGSGTDVSVYNDSAPGSEVKIPVEAYLSGSSIQQVIVKIGPLRPGESYVFGSAGYLVETPEMRMNQVSQTSTGDIVVGGVSPTSPAVEAVNPLPTVILWSLLGQTAIQLGYPQLSLRASVNVTERFFLSFPEQKSVTLSNGLNLFLYDEPAVCALAVQQSTTNLLHYFIESFLRAERLNFHSELFSDSINWSQEAGHGSGGNRKIVQLRYLQSLSKTTAVVALATSLGNQELTVKVLSFAEQCVLELMKYDVAAMKNYIEKYVACCIICLQRISKRHWHVLEHQLYQFFLFQYLSLSLLNGNLKPALKLLSEYYPEIKEKEIDALAKPQLEVLEMIVACQFFSDASLPTPVKDIVIGDMKKLVQETLPVTVTTTTSTSPRTDPNTGEISPFWRLSSSERLFQLYHLAGDLANSPSPATAAQYEKSLIQDSPQLYSDYLEVLSQLSQELLRHQKSELVIKLFQRFPICAEFLADPVKSLSNDSNWNNITLLLPISTYAQYKAAQIAALTTPVVGGGAAGKKPAAGKAGKGNEPPVDPAASAAASIETLMKIPDRFLNTSEAEIARQFSFLGDLFAAFVQANQVMKSKKKDAMSMTYFTKSIDSPNQLITADDKLRFNNQLASPHPQPPSEESNSGDGNGDRLSPRISPRGNTAGVAVSASPEKSLIHAHVPENSLSSLQLIHLLGFSAECYQRGKKINSAVNSAVKLWNLIISDYYNPLTIVQYFHNYYNRGDERFQNAGKSVLHRSFLLIVQIFRSLYPTDLNANPLPTSALDELNVAPPSHYDARDRKMKVDLLLPLFLYLIKVEWLQKDYLLDLVTNCINIFPIFCEVPLLQEYCEQIDKEVLSLIVQAQEQLIINAKDAVAEAQEVLSNFITTYEENEKKKRKKKLRIERTEKTEEELLFEKEKDFLSSIIQEKQNILAQREDEMSQIRNLEDQLAAVISKEKRLLLRLRKDVFTFFQEIEDRYGKNCDYSVIFPISLEYVPPSNASVTSALSSQSPNKRQSSFMGAAIADKQEFIDKFHQIKGKYAKLAKTLRNQKEKVLLTMALHDFSNFLIKTQQFNYLRQCCYDSVDGLFNTLDTCQQWNSLSDDLLTSFNQDELIRGVPYVLIALGKLSKYCAYTVANENNMTGSNMIVRQVNVEEKILYSTMAVEIAALLFHTSIAHPNQLNGFAGYECYELQGFQSFPSDIIYPLYSMNDELITNFLVFYSDNSQLQNSYLVNYTSELMKCLPLVCLQEYLAMMVCHNPQLWLSSRLQRIRILIQCHFFAEAIAMMASIPYHIQRIQRHSVDRPYDLQYVSPFHAATTEKDLFQYLEVSSNGLRYYGNPAFFNNSLPYSEDTAVATLPSSLQGGNNNLKALQWLVNDYPGTLDKWLTQYEVKVPEFFWTGETRRKISEQRQVIVQLNEKAAALALEAKDKKKGGGKDAGGGITESIAEAQKILNGMIPTIRLFTEYQRMEIYLLVVNLLTEILYTNPSNYSTVFNVSTSSNGNLTTNHPLYFHAEAKKLLVKAKEILYQQLPSPITMPDGSTGFTPKQVKSIHDYYHQHFLSRQIEVLTTPQSPSLRKSEEDSPETKDEEGSPNLTHSLYEDGLTGEEKLKIELMQSDSDWLLVYNRIFILESLLLQFTRHYREVYGNAFAMMKVLKNPLLFAPQLSFVTSGGSQGNVASTWTSQSHRYAMFINNFWFQIRELQVVTNYYQARYEDIIALVNHVLEEEANHLVHRHYAKRLTYFLAKAYYKKGQFDDALNSCHQILSFCLEKRWYDVLYGKTIILKTMILKEKMRYLIPCGIIPNREFFYEQNAGKNIYYLIIEAIELLRNAKNVLEKKCYQEIGLLSYDKNITYHDLSNINNLITRHDLFSPKLHHFSDMHNNNPPLTVLPAHLQHHSAAIGGELSTNMRMSYFNQSLGLYHAQRNYLLRLGPIDAKEVYGRSPFLNLYLTENKVLLEIQLLLLQTIEDTRLMQIEDIIQKEYQLLKEENNRNNIKTKSKEDYFFVLNENDDLMNHSTPGSNKTISIEEKKRKTNSIVLGLNYQPNLLEFFQDIPLLQEQMLLGESCCKLLRHTLYTLPIIRSSIYYYTIKSRFDNLIRYQLYSNYQIYENNTIYNISNNRKEYQVTIEHLVIQPLLVTLNYLVQSQAHYLHDLIRSCFQLLVEIYGNSADIEIDELFLDNPSFTSSTAVTAASTNGNISLRMRYTIQFLQNAILVNQQRSKILRNFLDLCNKDSTAFQQNALATLPNGYQTADLARLLVNVYSSSASPILPYLEEVPPKEVTTEETTAGKGGKDAKGKPAAAKDAKGATGPSNTSVVPGNFVIDNSRQLSGRDAVALLSLLLKEITPAVEYHSFENHLIYDLHLLLKKNFPTYETQCCLTKYSVAAGSPPTSSADVLIHALMKEISTTSVTVNVSSISTSWKYVATPKDWYIANPPPSNAPSNAALAKKSVGEEEVGWSINRLSIEQKGVGSKAASKYQKQNWNDVGGNTAIYGFYSHVAFFVLLGDALPIKPIATTPAAVTTGKGAAKPDPKAGKDVANSSATSSESVKPVLTKIVLSRHDVVQIEKKFRKLYYDLTYEKKEISMNLDNPINYGTVNDQWLEDLFELKNDTAKDVLTRIVELQEGGMLKFNVENPGLTYYPYHPEVVNAMAATGGSSLPKINFLLPINSKILQNFYQLFSVYQDQLNVMDNEICSFIRYALGHPITPPPQR